MSNNYAIFSLAGKVIIVTGGSSKYGYHFCEGLAEAGGRVIVTSREQQRAEETAQAFRAKGLQVFGYRLDQREDESIDELVSAVIADHGKIDVLVNNARTIPQMPSRTKASREELVRAFDVNCVGLILLTRRVLEEMKKAGGGNIINIGSIYGMGGQYPTIYSDPEASLSFDYPIHKGGTIAYTKQLATTQAQDNIRANCLSLGGLAETVPEDPVFLEGYKARVPLGRMTVGGDIKGAIIFLASDASAYMTGANLVVDGGWTAW